MQWKLPSRRMTWSLTVVLLTAIAWWLGRGPREPVFKGKKLSWWFTDGYDRQGAPKLTGDELRSLGPDAVRWLSYKAGQSSIVDIEEPSNNANAARRFLWDLHERWFHEGSTKFSYVRFRAVAALGDIGPEATPAIPSLLKALRCPEGDTRAVAAEALLETGRAGWPAVASAICAEDTRSRWLLLSTVERHWLSPESPLKRASDFGTSDFVPLFTLLESQISDRDEDVRREARTHMEKFATWWTEQPDCKEGIRLLADGMGQMPPSERRAAADLLTGHDFPIFPASVIPQFTKLAETDDLLTRIHLLGALSVYDAGNSRWLDELRKLAKSSDTKITGAAEDALGLSWRPGRKRIDE